MDNSSIKRHIEAALKADARLWTDDNSQSAKGKKALTLNQTALLDLVEKTDEKIIGLLFENSALKKKFFVKLQEAYVFKNDDFRFFMEENKIDNSYTAYKNRIGLTDGKRFIRDTNDVVLNFPYKDCVLEGGQSAEEGKDTRFVESSNPGGGGHRLSAGR